MNFLELCQTTREKCGISGGGPSSVLNQSGEMLRIVNWVNEAWVEIQNLNAAWMWMRGEFTLPLVDGQADYDRTLAVADDNFSHWHLDSLRTIKDSVADEQHIEHLDYKVFRDTYRFSTRVEGRSHTFAVRPWDQALMFAPVPDSGYTVVGEYQKSAQRMTTNGAVPSMPQQFHMLIVYEAMKRYAAYEAAPEILLGIQEERKRMMSALTINQLMSMGQTEALA